MKILKNKNNRIVAAALLLVIAVYVLRFVGMYVYLPKLCGILRPFIYIGQFVFWGFSLRARIIQKQVRRYLTAAAALMVFWFVIRTVKFNFLCIHVCAIIVYIALYGLDVQWLRFICGDETAFICFMYAAALEICIQCGFIQANTKYMELFDASTVGVQITDDDYNVILSSKAARSADRQLLRLTENGAVMLDDGIRLSGAPIHGGHVVWYEDMSDLIAVLEELNEAKEELEDSNEILEEENAVKAREAHIAEQDRLYNIIGQETAKQISLMDTLIRQAENSADDNERVRLLRKCLLSERI